METQRGKILVLGLGNDILTDDGVGLMVVRALRERFAKEAGVDFVDTTEMGLALLDEISGHDGLLLVDSVQTGKAEPGTIHETGEEGLKVLPGMSPHFLGVGEILVLGRRLGQPMPARVKIFAIEVADPFTLGTKLTPRLEAALPEIIERVSSELRQWLQSTAHS